MNDSLFNDVIFAVFCNESKDDGTEKSLSIVQKMMRKLMDMVNIKKGVTVDSGDADYVMIIGKLLKFLIVNLIGPIRVAADETRIPNVG